MQALVPSMERQFRPLHHGSRFQVSARFACVALPFCLVLHPKMVNTAAVFAYYTFLFPTLLQMRPTGKLIRELLKKISFSKNNQIIGQ